MSRPSTAAIGSIGATIPARVRAGMRTLPLPRSYSSFKPRDVWPALDADDGLFTTPCIGALRLAWNELRPANPAAASPQRPSAR